MSHPSLEQVQRILKKLENVRQRRLSCFGSDSHNFLLNPPLDEDAVKRFEGRKQLSSG
jgi:hypothetical protein